MSERDGEKLEGEEEKAPHGVEGACWALEKPDPGVFAGEEKRGLLFRLASAQWVPPRNRFACLNVKI